MSRTDDCPCSTSSCHRIVGFPDALSSKLSGDSDCHTPRHKLPESPLARALRQQGPQTQPPRLSVNTRLRCLGRRTQSDGLPGYAEDSSPSALSRSSEPIPIPMHRVRSLAADEQRLAEAAAVAELAIPRLSAAVAPPPPCQIRPRPAPKNTLQAQLWREQAAAATAIAQQRSLQLKVAQAEAEALALHDRLAAAEEERDRLARECSAMVSTQLRLRQAGLVESIYTQFDLDLPQASSCYAQHARYAAHTTHRTLIQ